MQGQTGSQAKESNVDVLIIGAGPTGFMLAVWFSRLGINARIIDKSSDKVQAGQADGLHPRMMEIIDSFGFVHRPLTECTIGFEACYYEPDANGQLHKVDRRAEGIPGISRYNGSVIHQGRIEQWFIDAIDGFSKGTMKVERPILPDSLDIDESRIHDQTAYPVTVKVRKLAEQDAHPEQYGHRVQNGLHRQFGGEEDNRTAAADDSAYETIHAKYVLGTDGAHSWVRKQLGIVPVGETTDHVWGVLDIVPITDFPDIRKRCSIHSASEGSMMVIPREGVVVRFYIQLKGDVEYQEQPGTANSSVPAARRIDRSKITADMILERAQRIMAPYTLEPAETLWFTGYQIGQRVAPTFHKHERVFIAGDACHTHSPKAGQGMNVSMMDAHNLAWKIAHVVRGRARPSILSTYESERLQVANDLIAYDTKLSRLFSAPPGTISTDEFRKVIEQGMAFSTGCPIDYDASLLVSKPNRKTSDETFTSSLATRLFVGQRIPDHRMGGQCEGRPWWLHERLPSTGAWRILNFCGDFQSHDTLKQNVRDVGEYFVSADSFVKRYTPKETRFDSVVDNILIHACDNWAVEWNDVPEAWRPKDHRGVVDYWKVFGDMDNLQGNLNPPTNEGRTTGIYDKFGIDKDVGALVVVRPDGHVAKVTRADMEGVKELEGWFGAFMVPAN
ncbi:FAD binding domain-containing protein [Apodospora peruviana]|uniref:FAD binding domain-containing protein n=1 Tax=Apodospora peruviana TaxID=516989 RepID=A0AAE0HT48_9PEZI|nr:FAD binding domain-containing protein [Apodospora peruviana]